MTLCAPARFETLTLELAGGTVAFCALEGDWEQLLTSEECRQQLNRQDMSGLLQVGRQADK